MGFFEIADGLRRQQVVFSGNVAEVLHGGEVFVDVQDDPPDGLDVVLDADIQGASLGAKP